MHSENTQGEAKKYHAPLTGGSDVRWVQPSVGDILVEERSAKKKWKIQIQFDLMLHILLFTCYRIIEQYGIA